MDVFLAICQGAGLAVAGGIGGLLVPLLASALAVAEIGWDLEGTDLSFVAEPWFLITLVVLNLAFFARGRLAPRMSESGVYAAAGLLAAGCGGILAAASLAEETTTWWPGIALGIAASYFALTVTSSISEGAQKRAGDAGGSIVAMFAAAGLVLAALSIFVPPVGLAALLALAYLAATRRRKAQTKYEGLRTLR